MAQFVDFVREIHNARLRHAASLCLEDGFMSDEEVIRVMAKAGYDQIGATRFVARWHADRERYLASPLAKLLAKERADHGTQG